MGKRLTGSFYFKRTIYGMVLYVAEETPFGEPLDTPDGMIFSKVEYRKATEEDIEVLRQMKKL